MCEIMFANMNLHCNKMTSSLFSILCIKMGLGVAVRSRNDAALKLPCMNCYTLKIVPLICLLNPSSTLHVFYQNYHYYL